MIKKVNVPPELGIRALPVLLLDKVNELVDAFNSLAVDLSAVAGGLVTIGDEVFKLEDTPKEPEPMRCPFCGCPRVTTHKWKLSDEIMCECDECSATGALCETEQEAIKAWNTRA